MAGGKSQRRVATVVFADVVDSTRIAAEVGDGRWRELLGAFRATVRRQLKRFNGHEVDTAGDGFFAWFDSPANAIRAAVAICAEAQANGLDVRCGLHTGELEQIDGRLGGIAAHIGARVMASAGPAEVLATTTVRDLVVGGGVTFDSIGERELKGVPGTWTLQRVTTVDGHNVPSPLEPAEAGQRRSPAVGAVSRRGAPAAGGVTSRRGRAAAGVAASLFVVGLLVVLAYSVLGFGRNAPPTSGPTQLANSSANPTPTQPADAATPTSTATAAIGTAPSLSQPLSLMQMDPTTNTVTAEIRDDTPSGWSTLLAFGGNLFQSYLPANQLVQRDLSTGTSLKKTDLAGSGCCHDQQGFGSIWHAYRQPYALIDRIDPTSGQVTKTLHPNIQMTDFAVGDQAVYLLDHDGQIHEINPITDQETAEFPSQAVGQPPTMWYSDGKLIFRDGKPDLGLTVIDATTHALVHRWTGLTNWADPGTAEIDPSTGTLWLTNPLESTITSFDFNAATGGSPTGLATAPQGIAVGFGSVWVAGGGSVYRLDSAQHSVQKAVAMPQGADAFELAMDNAHGKIWVSNCHGPFC